MVKDDKIATAFVVSGLLTRQEIASLPPDQLAKRAEELKPAAIAWATGDTETALFFMSGEDIANALLRVFPKDRTGKG